MMSTSMTMTSSRDMTMGTVVVTVCEPLAVK